MKKYIVFAALASVCLLLAGCGSSGNTRKIRKTAVAYINEKYGFKAKAGRVSEDGVNWLTPVWEKSRAGIVEMTYEGRTFYVHASIDSGTDGCMDNYMEDEFCSHIASYFDDRVVCEKRYTNVAYTEGNYRHMVGRNVMTYEDLLNDDRIAGINVYMTTYGLNAESLKNIDMSEMPEVDSFVISDRLDDGFTETDILVYGGPEPVSSPGVGYYAYFDREQSVLSRCAQEQIGDIYITYAYADDIKISECTTPPVSGYSGKTPWYQITNSGDENVRIDLYYPMRLAQDEGVIYSYERGISGEDAEYPRMMMRSKAEEEEDKDNLNMFMYDYINAGETVCFRIIAEKE